MYYKDFSRERWQEFRDMARPGPIHMLNLVRFREQADYADGRVMTGREAYAEYGRQSAAALERVGGRIIWRGVMEQMLIGPDDKQWDLCLIVEYPSANAFRDMQRDPEYQKAVENRQAGILDSRLIRMNPMSEGDGFAG